MGRNSLILSENGCHPRWTSFLHTNILLTEFAIGETFHLLGTSLQCPSMGVPFLGVA